jgi:hypothetical protein
MLGRRIRCKDEVGRIVEGHADAEATVVISFAARTVRPHTLGPCPSRSGSNSSYCPSSDPSPGAGARLRRRASS